MSFHNEPPSFLEISNALYNKIQADWYEFTCLGLAAKIKYWFQVFLYKVGLREQPVDKFFFPELEWDLWHPEEEEND